MNLKQFIEGQAPNEWSIEKRSGEAGTLSLRWHVLHGETDTHTDAVGSGISGDDFSYTLTGKERVYDAAGGYEVVYTYSDVVRKLDDTPCFLRQNLLPEARVRLTRAATWGLTNLVKCSDILQACAEAADRLGVTLDFSSVKAGDLLVTNVDNASTIGGVLNSLVRHVPNMTTRVEGGTVTLCGGQGEPLSMATYARAVVECSPDMKSGTLTVGSTVVDLAGVYAANAGSLEPLNWYVNCARLICDALVDCVEADAMQQGRYIFLTAREPGAAGNDIALALSGVSVQGRAAVAPLVLPEDLTQAGSISDGVTTVELEAEEDTNATASVQLAFQQGIWPEFGLLLDGEPLLDSLWQHELSAENVADWVDFLNSDAEGGLQGVAVASVDAGVLTFTAAGEYSGAAGNDLQVRAYAPSPFTGSPQFSGGADGGRTVGDIVDAINGEDDFPFTVSGGAIETKASGSAEIAARAYIGCTVAVERAGEIVVQKGIKGLGATLQALVDEINAKAEIAEHVTLSADGQVLTVTATEAGAVGNELEFIMRWVFNPPKTYRIALSGGADGSPVVLTAKETGSAGNGIAAYASGCFGTAGSFRGGADASGVSYGVTPFSGGGGQDLRAPYDGLLGQRAREDLPEDWRVTRHTISEDEGNKPPTAVVGVKSGLYGEQKVVFAVPEGASPYQEGALVVDVDIDPTTRPQVEQEVLDDDSTKEGARRGILQQAVRDNRLREDTQPWMTVKGTPIPEGWAVASGAVKMNVPHVKDREKWQRFWAQFGAFKVLGEITEGFAFGKPYFFPIAAEEAYPPDDAPEFAEAPKPGALRPVVREVSNVPANYKILTPADNMHLLIDGSFPASSKAGGNVGGLHFCKGCLKQYVFIDGNLAGISKQDAMDFFKGSYKFKGKTRRFVCLKVDGVFIDRRRKRFQVGTNKRAPEDPDYDEDVDGGRGWHVIGERTDDDPEPQQGLTKADYIAAAKDYLAACGNAGTPGRTEEISAHVMGGDFDPGLTVDDVFAVLGMAPAASGGYSYDSSSREVTARGSAGQAANLELDDFLTRRRAVKEAAWLDWKERHKDAVEAKERDRDTAGGAEPPEYPLTPTEWQQEREKDSYPMVSPSINASAGVSNEDAPLNPFQVYADGEKWFINEGEIASPDGPIYCETQEIPAGLWRPGRRFYVKAVYDRAQGKYVARYKYHDKATQDDE